MSVQLGLNGLEPVVLVINKALRAQALITQKFLPRSVLLTHKPYFILYLLAAVKLPFQLG